jgi:hypothetical protein
MGGVRTRSSTAAAKNKGSKGAKFKADRRREEEEHSESSKAASAKEEGAKSKADRKRNSSKGDKASSKAASAKREQAKPKAARKRNSKRKGAKGKAGGERKSGVEDDVLSSSEEDLLENSSVTSSLSVAIAK